MPGIEPNQCEKKTEGNLFEIISDTIEKSLTLANCMKSESDAYVVCVDALVFIQNIVNDLITESEGVQMIMEGLANMEPEQLLHTISVELQAFTKGV